MTWVELVIKIGSKSEFNQLVHNLVIPKTNAIATAIVIHLQWQSTTMVMDLSLLY